MYTNIFLDPCDPKRSHIVNMLKLSILLSCIYILTLVTEKEFMLCNPESIREYIHTWVLRV